MVCAVLFVHSILPWLLQASELCRCPVVEIQALQEALRTMSLGKMDVAQMSGLLMAIPDDKEAAMVESFLKARPL